MKIFRPASKSLITRSTATRIGLILAILFLLIGGFGSASLTHAAPGILYVDGASGADSGNCQTAVTPCKTISYAITQAVATDMIYVAQGTYAENLVVNSQISLMGSFEAVGWTRNIALNVTTLDGSQSGTVVDFQAGSDDAVLDGFTITNGSVSAGGMGGGITMNDVSPIVKNTQVISNQNTNNGGGIYISGGAPTFENLLVDSNTSGDCCGGVHIGNNATVDLSGSTISNNTAVSGGGVGVFSSSTVTITNSTISGNDTGITAGQGGGLMVSDSGTVVNLVDTTLADNQTVFHGGAISADGGTVNLTNALIYGNSSSSMNANVFAIGSTDFTIMNSTIADNNPGGAQAVILWSGSLTMTNSIMYNNAFNLQGDPPCPTCFTVTYSNMQGGYPGTGNIDADPMFVDAASQDYHLQSFSPSWNSGTAAGAPSADIEGTPRDASPDMGAYEWAGYLNYLPIVWKDYSP
ncbi:MAG TPA: choice-of-anchor Q domain-containing protein [Anaerolineales bacterium]|nr:choice-of-anchor Q domain-containing protein [Anaerolineales bacterium]